MNITSAMLHSSGKRAENLANILNAALQSVDPDKATYITLHKLQQDVDFSKFRRVGLVSIGKAAIPMAQATVQVLGNIFDSGIVVTKKIPPEYQVFPEGIRVYQGNHPVPGYDSVYAGEEVIRYLAEFDKLEAVLFLISGGASALVTHPVYAVELEDLVAVTQLLLECGASIDEINMVRKHLDDCKGGGLAVYTSPAVCISLILSDVIGNRLDVVASGPTVADPTTFAEAKTVLEKYNLIHKIPEAVLSFLTDGIYGTVSETPKPGDDVFRSSRVEIIASLEQAMLAAKTRAAELGYTAEFFEPLLTGEARDWGVQLGEFLHQKAELRHSADAPRCWIGGGETTVTKMGSGVGGRNQEMALAAVEGLAGVPGAALITFATDGEDGQSPAAGAIVTGTTLQEALDMGINPATYLARNDSYTFFAALNASIITGSTGTNVNDLVLILLD